MVGLEDVLGKKSSNRIYMMMWQLRGRYKASRHLVDQLASINSGVTIDKGLVIEPLEKKGYDSQKC